MLRHLIKLSGDSLTYGIGGALARFTGLILLPLYANLFTTAEYGIFQTVTNLGALLLGIAVLGLDGATGMLYFASDNPDERRQVCTLWIAIAVVVAGPLAVLLMLASDWLSVLSTGVSEHTRLFRLGVAALPFTVLVFAFSNILRFLFRARSYVALNLGVTVLVASLVVYLVGIARMGLEGALWGTLIANAAIAGFGAWVVRGAVDLRFLAVTRSQTVTRTARRMLHLGLPLVPASLALWVISFSNTYFLVQMVSAAEAGVFRMGAQLASILALGVWGFQLAWGPYSLAIARDADAPRTYARMAVLFTTGVVGVSVLMAALAPILLAFLASPRYMSAAPVVGLLSLSAAAQGLYSIAALGLNLAQRTGPIAWSTMAAALASIILNIALIPTLGLLGASVAALISNVILALLVYRAAQKVHPIPYEPVKIAAVWLTGLACTVIAGLFYATTEVPLWLSAVVAVGLGATFAGAALALRAISFRELSAARASIAGALARRYGSG
ncbi:MAG TPA: polysaccharide biosynthesis C-terminal domain-containing protein [Chloroflexia bacterium]|nr:polysaccharide biosynthesis C-terminal domain-containing protein [Chloroflexia bacterium]